MGIFDLIFRKKKLTKLKCPNCKKEILVNLKNPKERCEKCGVHISSMFKLKCPNCKSGCELNSKKCHECGFDFNKKNQTSTQTYRCPICGFRASYYMTRCPSCSTKFI